MALVSDGQGLGLPVVGERVRLEAAPGGAISVVRLGDDARVGTIETTLTEKRVLFIERFCIEAAERGYGVGSEAAWLLTAAAREAGFESLLAWAPPGLGLAVYFWMRMGFHPRFGPREGGGIRFERAIP